MHTNLYRGLGEQHKREDHLAHLSDNLDAMSYNLDMILSLR